jgi:hypothetical protein
MVCPEGAQSILVEYREYKKGDKTTHTKRSATRRFLGTFLSKSSFRDLSSRYTR